MYFNTYGFFTAKMGLLFETLLTCCLSFYELGLTYFNNDFFDIKCKKCVFQQP